MHTVKWFLVLLLNTRNCIYQEFLCIIISLIKWLNCSVWDNAPTGTTTQDQNRPGYIGNKEVFHILLSSRTGASPFVSYPGYCQGLTLIPRCSRQCNLRPQSTEQNEYKIPVNWGYKICCLDLYWLEVPVV